MSKRVKFKMPVGAMLGPIRHLGNGEFIMDYGDAPSLEGHVKPGDPFGTQVESPSGQKFEAIVLEAVEDPYETELVLAQARAPFVLVHEGKGVVDSDHIEALLAGQVH